MTPAELTPNSEPPTRTALLRAIAIAPLSLLIRAYQILLSSHLPRVCRFEPSCSQYALDALRRRGLIIGSVLAAYRIIRCNPFSRGGFDPVERAS